MSFDSLEISTDASVWPALSKTPPFLATIGNTCPGDTISLFLTLGLIAVLIVFARSCAEIPVVTPFLASIEIVNAVCILDLLFEDINGNFKLSTCFFVKAKQIKPLPCFAMKLILLELHLEPGIIKSPSFSLFLSSTNINILPFLAS